MGVLSKQNQMAVHSPTKVKGRGGALPKPKGKEIGNIQKQPLRNKRKRVTFDDDNQVKNAVMERAKEIQANLSPQFPSLVKQMLQSHVTRGFWLGLSSKFCQTYLPKEDTIMVLEDENGKEFEAKYLAEKVGLSAGWRGFSVAHEILEGDVVVFQLVRPTKFKVYIVRCSGSNEVDGALGLLKLEAGSKPAGLDNEAGILDLMDNMTLEEIKLAHDISQESKKLFCALPHGTVLTPAPISSYHSENVSDNLVSEVLDGMTLSESDVEFKDVKSIDDFSIVVNGLIINSELSKHHHIKYYDLCRSQNSFLHEHLLEGLNCKLAAGVIAETINIADAVRASKLVTSEPNFVTWSTTLKAFEVLGMNVGFFQKRLDRLIKLSRQSMRCNEAKCERDCAKDEKKLEAEFFEVNEKIRSLDTEIRTLEGNVDRLELIFEEVAKAPW